MIYTVEQLIEDFRSDVFDKPDVDDGGVERDVLWSDTDIIRYINSACARLASDTLALRKRFEITIAAGQAQLRFPLDEIIEVISAGFVIPGIGRRRNLQQFDMDEGLVADDYGLQVYTMPDFEAEGMPTHFTRDYDNASLRLWKVPYMAGVFVAHAIIIPSEVSAGMPVPFSARQDRDLLLMWMKKLAYAKQDADTLDLDRSVAFEAEYKRYMPDRRSEVDRARRDGGIIRDRS